MSNFHLFPHHCWTCGEKKKSTELIDLFPIDCNINLVEQLKDLCSGTDLERGFQKKDQLPQKICSQCRLRLFEAYEFREKCLEVYFEFKNKLIEVQPASSTQLETIHQTEYEFSHSTEDIDDDDGNLEVVKLEIVKDIQKSSVSDPIEDAVPNELAGQLTEIQRCVYEYHFCTQCAFKSSIAQNLRRHIIEHHDEIGKRNEVQLLLNDHLKNVVTYINFNCCLCDEQFDDQTMLFKHLKCSHTKLEARKEQNYIYGLKRIRRLYECQVCSKMFRTANDLKFHICTNDVEPIHCQICGDNFNQRSDYEQHLASHEKSISIIDGDHCTLCQSTFLARNGFLEHLKRCYSQKKSINGSVYLYDAVDSRKHECTICSKLFRSKANLSDHIRVHTGDRPFECDICGRSFSQISSLRQHMTIHTGIKPHICDVCGSGFTIPANLRRHEVTHSNSLPYACNQCPAAYNFKANLVSHIRKAHTSFAYECNDCCGKFSFCDRTYREKRSLLHHLKKEHNLIANMSMIQKNIPVRIEHCTSKLEIEIVD